MTMTAVTITAHHCIDVVLPEGMFWGITKHSSKLQSIWTCAMSGIGVIFLKRCFFIVSDMIGMYLSNKMVKLAFSA